MANTSASAAVAATKTRLEVQPNPGTVYDGWVPNKVPTDSAGNILPYVVIFAGAGTDLPEERDYTNLADLTVMALSLQTTFVAASPAACRDYAAQGYSRLLNLPIGTGWLKPDAEAFNTPVPLLDDQVTPARFYMPLRWRLTTT